MNQKTIVIFAALMAASAGAQQVYRCGNSYASQPCPGAAQVSAVDSSNERDAARARAAAKVDAERAAAYEKARLAQEKQAPKAIVMAPPQAAASAPAAKGAGPKGKADKGKKPEHFTAVAPGPAKKTK